MPTYQIDMYAGSPGSNGSVRRGADVHLTLYGTKASSGELVLGDGNTFQRRLADLGELKRLHVRHDDVGLGPRWFLERITIRNVDTQEEWSFPCNRWLARNEDDGEIERTLDAA